MGAAQMLDLGSSKPGFPGTRSVKSGTDTLPPQVSFTMNSYKGFRLDKGLRSQRLFHVKKFALVIHIDGWGLLALDKTCRSTPS
jgi:hypothetical protein